MGKKLLLIFLLALLPMVISGCWDRVEIEERGFVVGATVDTPKNVKAKEHEVEEAGKTSKQHRYSVTYQFVVPGELKQAGGKSGGSGGGGGNGYFNITSEGDTMYGIARQIATRTSRSPYFEHIKVIIVSESIAKTGKLGDILDFFLRDPDMRRSAKLMIAQGRASKALEIQPKSEKLPVVYIESISKNIRKSARMLPFVKIGDVQSDILHGYSYALPRIVAEKSDMKVAGASIFQGINNKMVGHLGEMETMGLNFLQGEFKEGVIKTPTEKGSFVYEVKEVTRKIHADTSNKEHVHFTIDIESEGDIGESLVTRDFLDQKVLIQSEKQVAMAIKKLTQKTVNRLHKKFKVDAIGVGRYLKENEPKLWDEVEKDWDSGKNYFAKSTIDVNVVVHIRGIGSISKTKRKD
jgi:spore germination protein